MNEQQRRLRREANEDFIAGIRWCFEVIGATVLILGVIAIIEWLVRGQL